MQRLTSLQHPLLKRLVRLRDKRSARYDEGALLIEGQKMVRELCVHTPARALLVTDEALLTPDLLANEVYLVSPQVMSKISALEQPEGICAEVAMPDLNPRRLHGLRRMVVLDGVQDPGNLGTLLRTALALGWEGAFLLNGCCDPFNDKALRAAKGATFRLPLAAGDWSSLQQLAQENKMTCLMADLKGKDVSRISLGDPLLLVLGSEGQGVSAEAVRLCDPVTISMPGEMESLNVACAGAILMYTLR
jgi:TrmH family RNA methyltransferase